MTASKLKSNLPEVKAAETLAAEEEDSATETEEASEAEEIVITASEEEMIEDHEEISVTNQRDVSIVVRTVTSPETAQNVIFILFSEKTKRIQRRQRQK